MVPTENAFPWDAGDESLLTGEHYYRRRNGSRTGSTRPSRGLVIFQRYVTRRKKAEESRGAARQASRKRKDSRTPAAVCGIGDGEAVWSPERYRIYGWLSNDHASDCRPVYCGSFIRRIEPRANRRSIRWFASDSDYELATSRIVRPDGVTRISKCRRPGFNDSAC